MTALAARLAASLLSGSCHLERSQTLSIVVADAANRYVRLGPACQRTI